MSPFFLLSRVSLCFSEAEGYPELDRRSGTGFAVDPAPSARKLRALAHRHQADVTGDAQRFRRHKPGAVVGHLDSHTSVGFLGDDGDACRVSVLLYVGQSLRDVLQEDRLDRIGDSARDSAVVVRLDAGADAHQLQTFLDLL